MATAAAPSPTGGATVQLRRRDGGTGSRTSGSRPLSGLHQFGDAGGVAAVSTAKAAAKDDANSGIRVAKSELRRMRYHILVAVAVGIQVVTLCRIVFFASALPHNYSALIPLGAILVASAAVVVFATEKNTQALGMAFAVTIKILSVARVFSMPNTLTLVVNNVFGSGRILPMLGAVFGGVYAGLAFGIAWILEITFWYSPVYEALWSGPQGHRHAVGAAGLPGVTSNDVACAYLESNESVVLMIEYGYTVIVTVISCAVVFFYEDAISRLGDALDRRRVFISNINHEIRTPLVGVISLADILVSSEGLPVGLLQQLEVIRASGKAVLNLINNMLDLSRIDARALELESRVVNLRDFTHKVTDTFAAIARSKNIVLDVTVRPDVPIAVAMDEFRVHQVLGNLLGNAFKFTHTGRIELSVWVAQGDELAPTRLMAAIDPRWPSPPSSIDVANGVPSSPHEQEPTAPVSTRVVMTPEGPPRLAVDTTTLSLPARLVALVTTMRGSVRLPPCSTESRRRQAGPAVAHVCFAVRDTGIGVKPAAVATLFEPFQQGDTSTVRHYGGSGLGLAICRELAAVFRSYLLVESQVGVGTAFLFTVPLVHADPALAPPSPPPPESLVAAVASRLDQVRYDRDSGGSPADAPLAASARRRSTATLTAWPRPAVEKDHLADNGGGDESSPPLPAPAAAAPSAAAAVVDGPETALPDEEPRPELALRLSADTDPAAMASELSSTSQSSLATMMSGQDADAGAAGEPRPTVLLVEDNPLNANVLRRQLQILGCDTVWVQDGALAVEMYRNSKQLPAHEDAAEALEPTVPPDGSPTTVAGAAAPSWPPIHAVLMDLNMPIMSGVDATRIVRALEAEHGWQPVPIIALTADDRSMHADECRAVGMNEFLTKPTTLQALEDLLRNFIPIVRSRAGRQRSTSSSSGVAPMATTGF